MKKSEFEFSKIELESMTFEKNDEFNSEKEDIGIGMEAQVSAAEIDDTHAAVRLSLNIGNETEAPFSINIVMRAIFGWTDSFPKEMVDSLLQMNAPAVLLSYARPIVSLLTGRAGMVPFEIPFINFTENEDELEENETE